jgi:hypothetical protein
MRFAQVVSLGLCGVVLAAAGARTQSARPSPLPQFRGTYSITGEPGGAIQVSDALGGSFTEWVVRFEDPRHEVRLMVGERRADGTFPVWRFEQDPAPLVEHQGAGRLSPEGFVADFESMDRRQARFLRERWTLTRDGLQFDLEASANGVRPQRVGGFVAIRQ